MMEILGFLFCVLVMCYISLFSLAVLFNCGGQYNIGGVHNSRLSRFASYTFVACVGYLWYLLFVNAPFTITIN